MKWAAILDKSLLIRIFGYRAAFLHGDCLMLDRWRFVQQHLPVTANGESVLDVGCGSGAYAIALAKRGYTATGLSWDERNQSVAEQRARIAGAKATRFPIGDARKLDTMPHFAGKFDYILSLENIEHIIDDRKLMRDLAACLKPGGWLVLTTPNQNYRAITAEDNGPFPVVENGWHVRRGYTRAMLEELCAAAGLRIEQSGSCSGFFSQKLTWLMRRGRAAGWAAVLPLRIVPLLLDRLVARLTGYPDYSLTLVAYKPRF